MHQSKLEQAKAERRKELLAILEIKKKELQKHAEESANNSIEVGKGLLAIGSGVFLLYTIFDRFLDAKFRVNSAHNKEKSSTKSASNKLLYPIFSMLLQQGSSLLYNESQKRLVDYLKNKKVSNERISERISEQG